MSFDYNNPILARHRKGNTDDPYLQISDTLVLDSNGKVVLTELPSEYERVKVTGDNKEWFEIREGVPNESQYLVDYKGGKLVTFNLINAGKQLSFSYKGMGQHFIPQDMIYTESVNGVVTETLKQLTDETKTARDTANTTNTTIQSQEDVRVTSENTRKTNEQNRVSAETARASAESTRESNESTRVAQETSRVNAESTRQTNTATAITNAETATTNANTAATNATTQANYAKTEADRIQTIDATEIANARVDVDGFTYTNVKTRLDTERTDILDKFGVLNKNIKTIGLNLADYGAFNVLVDYADITTIVEDALSTLPDIIKGSTGWRLFNVSVFVPGGHWTITKKRVFDISNYGTFPSVRGFNIYGAGNENTEIVFDSNVTDTDNTNFLIYNSDKYGFSEIKNVRFTAKNQVEKLFYMSSTTSGNGQSIVFDNVVLEGFMEGLYFDGNIMCSEIDYYSVKIKNVPVGGRGIFVSNPQSVNHNFFACDMEAISGVGVEFAKGGCANFFGGSYIAVGDGIVFKTSSISGDIGTSNHTFNFYGIRTELFSNAKIFDVLSYVDLSFDGCNLTVQDNNTIIRGILGQNRTNVSFKNCHTRYKFQVRIDNNVYNNGPCRVHFDCCTLEDQLSNIVTLNGSTSNVAGYPLIDAINTRYVAGGVGQKPFVDVAINKEKTNISPVIPVKSVFFRTGVNHNEGLPANAGGTFTLPLHAIITKVRIVHNVSNLVGTCSYDVKNNDGTVTFVSMPSTAQNVFVSAISSDLWYLVDTEVKRTIQITQAGTDVSQSGYVVVDYI